jgi:hypothetical protein
MSEFTIAEAVQFLLDARLEDTHTAIPGIITKYSGHGTRLATVQPTVRLPRTTGPDQDIPPIGGVPVVFPSSAAGTLFFPVRPGDGVLLVFSEVAIGKYLKSSGQDLSDAGTFSRHRLTDAIAIPGLFPAKAAPKFPSSADENSTVLVNDQGGIVEIGDVLGLRNQVTDLRTELEKLWAFFQAQLTKHTTDFSGLATAIAADAGFMLNTVTYLGTLVVPDTTDQATIQTNKAALAELLK